MFLPLTLSSKQLHEADVLHVCVLAFDNEIFLL